MAVKQRIIDFPETTEVADDDYILMDSETDGTKKILVSSIGGGGGSSLTKVEITEANYQNLTEQEKEDATKIYFITNTEYLYYMNIRYDGNFPITIESTNTVETTSTTSITLEAGYHYLFTTIYSGGVFNAETVKEGGASRVFKTDGYDRTMFIISTNSTNVTYNRTGSIDSNKYIKFRIKKGEEYADDLVFKNTIDTAFEVSNSPTLNLEAGKYYMITYKASLPPNLTGATPICYAYLGETDAKKSISMIIKADADTITIADYNTSYSYFYYQKLTY